MRGPWRATWLWAPTIATYAVVALTLILVLRHGRATAVDGFTSETGGRLAAVTLGLVAVVPWFIRRLDVRTPTWAPWVAGVMSMLVTSIMWFLVRSGLEGPA